MPPFGGAFAQQRPILSPIGQLLPVEGACVTGFPFCCINRAKHSAELATSGGPPYPAAPDFLHGKACHTILRSLCSLTARLSPTHNILRVTAFLQNMFAGVTRVPLPPHPGDRINRSALLCRVMWRSHQRGCCFSIAQKARLPGFSSYQPPDHPDSSRSAPPTGIYQQIPHHRRSPRSFAVAQDDKRESGLPSPQSILPV